MSNFGWESADTDAAWFRVPGPLHLRIKHRIGPGTRPAGWSAVATVHLWYLQGIMCFLLGAITDVLLSLESRFLVNRSFCHLFYPSAGFKAFKKKTAGQQTQRGISKKESVLPTSYHSETIHCKVNTRIRSNMHHVKAHLWACIPLVSVILA